MRTTKLASGNLPVEDTIVSRKMKKETKDGRDYPHNGYKAVKLLPNVRNFKVKISNYDIIFALHGIKKRLPPKMEFTPHTNKSMNRYIVHQLDRMTKCAVSNPVLCWRIGMRLVRKSNVFLVMAINHVFPR